MNPSTHLLNCQVCQCRLELHSSLCSADVGDETKQSYCDLSEIDVSGCRRIWVYNVVGIHRISKSKFFGVLPEETLGNSKKF